MLRALTGSLSQSGHSWACPSKQSRRWTRCARGEGSSGDAKQFVPIGCGILLVRCAPRQPPPSNQYMTRSVGQAAVHGSQTTPQRASLPSINQAGSAASSRPAASKRVLGVGTSRQSCLGRDQPPPSSRRAARAYGPSNPATVGPPRTRRRSAVPNGGSRQGNRLLSCSSRLDCVERGSADESLQLLLAAVASARETWAFWPSAARRGS